MDYFIKAICLCCILLGFVNGQTQPNDPFEKLSRHYYYKCWNYTKDEKVFDQLYRDGVELQNTLKFDFDLIPKDKELFCTAERKILEELARKFATDLEPCLPQQEKYMSEFFRKSAKEFLHFFCHNKGENMERLFSSSTSSRQCREALSTDAVTTELSSCFSRIFKPMSGYVKKQELCDDMSIAQKCVVQLVNEKCPQSSNYKTLSSEFFKYVRKPCSGCTFSLSISLLLASIILSYLFAY